MASLKTGIAMNKARIFGLIVAPVMLWAAAIFILAVAIASPGWPHEWYDQDCCNDKDCERLDPDLVGISPQGFHLPNGEIVAFRDTRISADNDYHWCRYVKTPTAQVIKPEKQKTCLYVPAGGA